ncbi:hypothetical protein HBI37_097570 [Parastagonospora nodorum]|nr:hypothetical protein HBI51_155880 [Parastagonospora nodorum]KAH6342136.1 hypothetical protein HBI37_097570 [Parastagonospora nodorum]KAH6355114.1 hypothetical protein HBI36_093000 [Parastagonospora nodorum]
MPAGQVTMAERESSVASSTDFYETAAKPVMTANTAQRHVAAAKRKAEDDSSAHDKKRRLASPFSPVSSALRPCAGLPPAVWQHVFLFCSLADLGRLMQVNRSFLSCLTDVHNVPVSKPDSACLRLLKSESVWASARNALSPRPPKPFPGFTELQMWQLAWSPRCQFCGKSNSFSPGEKIWQKGPGSSGVRTIWPFGIRVCGPCLMQRCQTETSLLFSAASALRPALPFALITNEHNYIPAHILQSANTPPDVEIGKYYYKIHVEEITRELNHALSLGTAAAEEWSKGLDAKGRERMKVADNWERWEARHHQERSRAPSVTSTFVAGSREEPSRSPTRHSSPIIHTPVPIAPSSQFAQPRPPTVPPQISTPQPGQNGSTQPSHQRNLHDANEAKASRKTDIERRCQHMSPPIPPNILRHMDSFKAAIQISQPMNDYAWSVLQPRLLAQLPAAQQAEANHVSHAASLSTKPAERRFTDANSKEAKEAMDREWEESQRPIRDRLSAIADDFIHQDWDQGKALTFDNCPKFAADLLTHVRRKFNETSTADFVTPPAHHDPTDDAAAKPKLVLENMKWVYDNKIKPLTEQFRKDLFFCNGQDCESSARPYGFEGVVQHFGAKHTHAFSSGNVVVAWREAEWPEETPFHPDPVSVQAFHHPHVSNGPGYTGHFGGYSRAGTATPHMPTHMPQASPGPYYGGNYNGPFHPPQTPGAPIAGYDYSQQFGTPVDHYGFAAMGPPGYVNQVGSNSYMPSPAMVNPGIAPPPAMPPPGHVVPDLNPNNAEDAGHSTSLFDKQVSTVIETSQDIWKTTSGVKDMPNSLRIYVLLHRVISKFHVEFNYEPNLNHFIDAFSNHETPKGLKLAPGLSCKACQVGATHQLTGAYYAKPAERKTYTALNLLLHFRTQHLTPLPYNTGYGQQTHTSDWKEDMIELPGERFISGLMHAPGMDDEKLLMIATVFPSLFPMPLPKIGVIDSNGNGLISPPLTGTKDATTVNGSTSDAPTKSGPSSRASAQRESPAIPRPVEDDSTRRQHSHRDSPPSDRRQRVYAEPRYYMARDDVDDDYHHRSRDYVDHAPSPRIVHAGPAYGEYTGRRTAFREYERLYGPPPDEIIYAQPREGSHGREYGAYPRQARYYGEDDAQLERRYAREPQQRDSASGRGKSAADRFLEDFVPGQASTNEAPRPPSAQHPETGPQTPAVESSEGVRFTSPPPPNAPSTKDPEALPRQMPAPLPRPPSTVSNGSRYEEYHPHGRHIPTPESAGPSRRPGPHRRRDRPHEQRMPSKYYRYMSVARDEPYGRGPSMSRSQSRRYEEQRRRIDQQETPQPNADHDYEPAYSRDHSVENASPDDRFHPRPTPREYVSVQDRLHHFSPPRFRYDEPRGPPPVYIDEYGYEVVMRREPRHARGSYAPAYHPPPARYEADRYEYLPYERPHPQRYNSRGEYAYYEDRERERILPRRPAPASEAEPEPYETAGPDIKVESAPVPMPPEGP